jgi:hypothetical protein
VPKSSPRALFTAPGPAIWVSDFILYEPGLPTREGGIVVDVAWLHETPAIRFSLPIRYGAGSATAHSYFVEGSSARAKLPPSLAKWAACEQAAAWSIFLETHPNEKNELSFTRGSLTWGPACNRWVSCTL